MAKVLDTALKWASLIFSHAIMFNFEWIPFGKDINPIIPPTSNGLNSVRDKREIIFSRGKKMSSLPEECDSRM